MPRAVKRPGKSSANGCGTRLQEPRHQLVPEQVRTTEFAPALSPAQKEATTSPSPSQGYGSAEVALPWKAGSFSGRDAGSPARWHAALSWRVVAGCKRPAQRSRRVPAGGLCGQHPQLSPLSPARTVSMAWESCYQASSGERVAAPAPHRLCSPALEGLEPSVTSTRVHAAPARPTSRSAGRTDPLGQPGCLTFAPFPCAACSTFDSRGKSGWLAMRVLSRLPR
jgi:hypothetical protein